MNEIRIRPAGPADMPAVHQLVRELAEYERAPEEVLTSPEELLADGFGPRPSFECLVAENPEGDMAGIALFFTAYSTWKGRVLYLDDLVVTERFRGRGIGPMLLEAVRDLARARGMRQVRWQVLKWNTPAIRMYERYAPEMDGEWINCRLHVHSGGAQPEQDA
ncbi:MAG: GNAT family N-acetyltransferase [Bacteroidia bacterium]|nr:GNAT family N-acetyltransferase [Bacteroidia bacterium]